MMRESNLYIEIWESALTSILKGLHRAFEEKKEIAFQMNQDLFIAVGNRKSYTFRLIYENGYSTRNGSAVGRDLQAVLTNKEFKDFAKGKFIIIRLTGDFRLKMVANIL